VEESADDTLKTAINEFLQKASDRDRKIFIRRYFFCDDIKSISKQFDVTETNVTTILSRLRKVLKEHLSENGIVV
jgi:RNA polymerase sigma-70 factor (ECF subfamily)